MKDLITRLTVPRAPVRTGLVASTAGFVLLALAMASAASAQEYPNRPIRLVLPYEFGGAAGLFSRTVAKAMSDNLGQNVYVDSKPGANGIIGTEIAARAAPDGYTIYMGAIDAMVITPNVYQNLPYDPVKDFAPISLVTRYPYLLIGNSNFPARTLNELIALAKAKPGELSFGSHGTGSSAHLAGAFVAQRAGIELLHVPYKGSAPALLDVLAGRVPLMFNTVAISAPHIAAGKVRAFGITGKTRSPLMPDVPTMEEQGLKGYALTIWQGILAPAGTPEPIVGKLNRAIVASIKSKEMVETLSAQGGVELVGTSPEEFSATIKTELATYSRVVKDGKIPIQNLSR